MATIVMADDGIVFDGNSLTAGPLGGAETAFASLAVALAARGHKVTVHNMCAAPMTRDGVSWSPLSGGVPEACDLYIANRSDKLLRLAPGARAAAFWIHNPAGYLLKMRYLWKLALRRMPIVFSGAHHAGTYPRWAPGGRRVVIPYGISEPFRTVAAPSTPPPPRAVFTSSPLRGLDWLLDLWQRDIRPRCPEAELHLFSGAATYGAYGAARGDRMAAVLDRARSMAAEGVMLREPVSKATLAGELATMRVLLYRGDVGETYCLAVGEAQAAGLPAVVEDIGCVAERVIDDETGMVAANDPVFADCAVALLTNDALWSRMSAAALAEQRGWGWDNAAAAFEELIP